MAVNDAIVVAGSMNYTAPANEYNDENIFVIGSPYEDLPAKEGGPVDPARCAEITEFMRANRAHHLDQQPVPTMRRKSGTGGSSSGRAPQEQR